MGINLPYHLKILENKQFLEENYNFFYNRAYVLYRIICVTIFHHGRRNSSWLDDLFFINRTSVNLITVNMQNLCHVSDDGDDSQKVVYIL